MISRRRLLIALPLAAFVAAGPAHANACEVAAPSVAVAALVAATAGACQITIDPALGPAVLRVAGADVDVRGTILLKGDAASQRRFLDDARNAAKLGASVRRALSAAYPERAGEFEANQRAWSRALAHDVLQWNTRLGRAAVRGQRVRDAHQRAYLLEWAGATVDAGAAATGPAALASLPAEPQAADLASYRRYIEALVAALAGA